MNRVRQADALLVKIRALPPEKITEVEDFVDFLHLKTEELLTKDAVTKLSEAAFASAWDNDDDGEYDAGPTARLHDLRRLFEARSNDQRFADDLESIQKGSNAPSGDPWAR